jgi:hypothetical protein
MSSNLFILKIPKDFLFELFEKICIKTDKYYLFDLNAFKKMVFYEYYEEFKKKIKPYYKVNKQFYIERKLLYSSFTNIIRQICKSNNIMYTSKIKYNESVYNIDYYIYF